MIHNSIIGGKKLPSLDAQTITPGTSDQIIAAGQYLAGDQTIKGDANLAANNIKSGVSIFGVNGEYTGAAPAQLILTGSGSSTLQSSTVSKSTYEYLLSCTCLLFFAETNNNIGTIISGQCPVGASTGSRVVYPGYSNVLLTSYDSVTCTVQDNGDETLTIILECSDSTLFFESKMSYYIAGYTS